MKNTKWMWMVTTTLLLVTGCKLDASEAKNQCATQADCLDGYTCNAGMCELTTSMPDAPTCTPRTCAADECGRFDDGCGDMVECGCTAPEVCRGAGVPNQCAVPTSECVGQTDEVLCANAALLECGSATVTDHCNVERTIDCGTCSAGTCGAQSFGLCDEIVCSPSGWCRALDGTLAGNLSVRDLWGTGSEVFAVAADNTNGTLLRFDGTRWKTHATGAFPLRTGAGTNASLLVASSNGAILTANNGAFASIATTNRIWTSMHSITPTDVWMVGHFGSGSGAAARVRHFDGGAYTDTNIGGTFDLGWHLLSVSAASNSVWAVGAAVPNGSVTATVGPIVASYNGTTWSVDNTLPTGQYLRAVYAAAPNDVWAVGDAGVIIHFDGNDWSSSTSGVTQPLYAITGLGNTLWAAGGGGVILKKVGTGAWTTEVSGTTRTINALWATSATDVWAGGEQGLLLRYDPSATSACRPEAARSSAWQRSRRARAARPSRRASACSLCLRRRGIRAAVPWSRTSSARRGPLWCTSV
jgi:hypothetical protein